MTSTMSNDMTKTYKLEGKIKITTEGDDFSAEVPAEEIKRLLKENPELLEEKGYKLWRAEKGSRYWYVPGDGSVDWSYEEKDSVDDFRYLTGNYFATKEEAEAHKARLEAIGRVTHAILEANEGWEPDWSDEIEEKYYLYYSHFGDNEFDWGEIGLLQETQTLPFAKSSEIVKTIIAEYEDDLRIIFNAI